MQKDDHQIGAFHTDQRARGALRRTGLRCSPQGLMSVLNGGAGETAHRGVPDAAATQDFDGQFRLTAEEEVQCGAVKTLFGAKDLFSSVDAGLHAQEINTGLCDEVDASCRYRRTGADDEYRVGGPADGEVGKLLGVRGGTHPLMSSSVGGAAEDVAHEVHQHG
ncbi:hypothetical protein ACFWPU_07230 [Streptomyces sp. NPDC058471]|uniref:hypothetical protein n=1 Tax=Streptomyces sp. NPDC058471 TaxID=3346516 RepID=UPI0036679420